MMKNMRLKVIIITLALFFSAGSGFAADINALLSDADKIVSSGLASNDGRVRTNAIEIAAFDKRMKFMPQITKMLGDSVVSVRFASAVAIGDAGYRNGKIYLKPLLDDVDVNVRMAAAYAYYKLGELKYLPIITTQATCENKDSSAVANAAMLLGKLKDKKSLKLLYRLKDNPNSSDNLAFNATEAIAAIGDTKIYSRIWTMLISAYSDDRYMGTRAMGALGTTEAAGALLSMLDDDIVEVRLSAAGQLGTLGDPSGMVAVLNYLGQKDVGSAEKQALDVRNTLAAMAIGQIGTGSLVGYLPKLTKSESVFVRLAAAKSIFVLAARR